MQALIFRALEPFRRCYFTDKLTAVKKNPTCPGKIFQGNPVLFRAITPYVAVQHSRNGLTGEIFYNFIRAGATFMQHKSLLFRAIWCYCCCFPAGVTRLSVFVRLSMYSFLKINTYAVYRVNFC